MKFLSVFILLACASIAWGQPNASYYVATTGTDSNPGTQSTPWKTVQHAADTVHAGSTVNVRGGTYEELVRINVSGNASDGFITFRSYPGEMAILDASQFTPKADRVCSRFKTNPTCGSKDLRFAISAPPNIASHRWVSMSSAPAHTSNC